MPSDALELTLEVQDDFHRRRRARAWLRAGRAALGSNDVGLARLTAVGIGPSLQDLREALDGAPLRGLVALWGNEDLYRIAMPTLPAVHERAGVIAEFDTLLEVGERRTQAGQREAGYERPCHPQAVARHDIGHARATLRRPIKLLANLYPRTPAMAAGISDHVLACEEIAALLD